MNTLDIIQNTIEVMNDMHIKFSTRFYNQEDFKSIKWRNLKKIYVSNALENDFFMQNFLLKYQKSILSFDFDSYLLPIGLEVPKEDNSILRYRSKLMDTTVKKMEQYARREQEIGTIPVYKCLNDLFGARLVLKNVNKETDKINNLLIQNKVNKKLKWYYYRNQDGYKSYQCYFQMNNKVLPWELQIWDSKDRQNNIQAHLKHEKERNQI